jgi:hypothetical protein
MKIQLKALISVLNMSFVLLSVFHARHGRITTTAGDEAGQPVPVTQIGVGEGEEVYLTTFGVRANF